MHLLVMESVMMRPMYHLLVGICANGYPFSHIPTNKWYSPHHHTVQYCKVHGVPMYHLSVGICANVPLKTKQNIIYLPINDKWAASLHFPVLDPPPLHCMNWVNSFPLLHSLFCQVLFWSLNFPKISMALIGCCILIKQRPWKEKKHYLQNRKCVYNWNLLEGRHFLTYMTS